MKTNTQAPIQSDAVRETSTFALGVGITMAVLIGIWGLSCFVSATMTIGPVEVLQGYITAVAG